MPLLTGWLIFFVNVCNNSVNDFYFWPGKVLSPIEEREIPTTL